MSVLLSTEGYPPVDEHILQELADFDPCLKLSFSPYRISFRTGEVLLTEGLQMPIDHPRWSVWYINPAEGKMFHLFDVEDENGDYAPVDGRVLYRIRSDMVNQGYDLDEVVDLILREDEERAERKESRADSLIDDSWSANKSIIRDAHENSREIRMFEDPKIFSYPGQISRGTRFYQNRRSNKDIGLELPDVAKELRND